MIPFYTGKNKREYQTYCKKGKGMAGYVIEKEMEPTIKVGRHFLPWLSIEYNNRGILEYLIGIVKITNI
jgi:hypothetical protein